MKKKNLWIAITGIIVVSISAWFFFNQGTLAEVETVKKESIKKYVEDVGTVKSVDSIAACVEGSGLIESISADVGQQVTQGETLLTLDSSQLKIQLEDAIQSIRAAEASPAESEYSLALYNYTSTKTLAEAGAVSLQEVKEKETALKNAESIRKANHAQLQQAILNRDNILLSIKKQRIISPINGTILEKKVNINTYVDSGTEAFEIGSTDNIEVEAYILTDDAADIKLGNEVEITERSEEKQVLQGTVVKIAPSAIEQTSSLGINQKKVLVTIAIQDRSAKIRPGYEVDVAIITKHKGNTLTVPISAVFDYKDKTCVFVVEEGKAKLRTVQKGIENDSRIELTQGIKEGETVLCEPDITIKEGTRIKVKDDE